MWRSRWVCWAWDVDANAPVRDASEVSAKHISDVGNVTDMLDITQSSSAIHGP
jgi:hypothetical protein